MATLLEHARISQLKRWTLRAGIPAVVVVGISAVAFAGVPHAFVSGEPLLAADLNANFSALDARLTALEANASPFEFVSVQAVAAADTLDVGNYSVYVACPAKTRPIGGGCSLFQTDLSGHWEYNSQGRVTGCPGALASTSRMCLRDGTEKIGDLINDGNGTNLTVSSLGWKCSMGTPPPNTSLRVYATCGRTP